MSGHVDILIEKDTFHIEAPRFKYSGKVNVPNHPGMAQCVLYFNDYHIVKDHPYSGHNVFVAYNAEGNTITEIFRMDRDIIVLDNVGDIADHYV